jgi:peptidoglycan/LPS O-acetylase OafA/YrhL
LERAAVTETSYDRGKIASINGLRGLAICAVVFHHSFGGYAAAHNIPFLSDGWMGVDLFFMLSGFVLYLPYAAGKAFVVKDFYIHRFMRLAPLFYFSAIVCVLITGAFTKFQLIALFSGLFTLFPSSFIPPANFVFWSLGVEFVFSALFPLLVWSFTISKPRTMLSIIAISLLVRCIGLSLQYFTDRAYVDWIAGSALGRMDEFAFGMIAAYLFVCGYIPKQHAGKLALAGCALVGGTMLGFERELSGSNVHSGMSAAFLISSLQIGLLCIILATLSSRSIGRIFSLRPLQIAGLMCYSIYVWHGVMLVKMFPDIFIDPQSVFHPRYLLYLALLIALSAMSYRFIEFRRIENWRQLFLFRSP